MTHFLSLVTRTEMHVNSWHRPRQIKSWVVRAAALDGSRQVSSVCEDASHPRKKHGFVP